MIVCVCKNISDKTIRQAVGRGMGTMSALREELGLGTCCGKCAGCARQLVRETLREENHRPSVFFQLVPPAALGGMA